VTPPKKLRRTSLGESPFSRVNSEVSQYFERRKPFLVKLEKHFEARVVSFFTSFTHLQAQITDDDAEMLESVLAAEHDGGKLVLVLNSPGGIALAAERIVNVCREYSKHNFEVVVPHMAKSAATMICFGASRIHMSRTAELGPVDPQVEYEEGRWISADEYVRSYDELVAAASGGKHKRIEPFIQQLNRYDAREIERLRSAQALSKDISVRLLKSGMMKTNSEASIAKKIEVFLTQSKTRSHGRMINHAGAAGCGLEIKEIDLGSPIWNDLWELFVRSDWAVSNTYAKLIESTKSSVHTGAGSEQG